MYRSIQSRLASGTDEGHVPLSSTPQKAVYTLPLVPVGYEGRGLGKRRTVGNEEGGWGRGNFMVSFNNGGDEKVESMPGEKPGRVA